MGKEEPENKADPLYRMNNKDEVGTFKCTNTFNRKDDESVVQDDGRHDAKIFQRKCIEVNDGTKYDLIADDDLEQGDRKRKRKSKRDNAMDEDMRFIQSLDKEKRLKLLKEIEKREKKRKAKKKKRKRKHKK